MASRTPAAGESSMAGDRGAGRDRHEQRQGLDAQRVRAGRGAGRRARRRRPRRRAWPGRGRRGGRAPRRRGRMVPPSRAAAAQSTISVAATSTPAADPHGGPVEEPGLLLHAAQEGEVAPLDGLAGGDDDVAAPDGDDHRRDRRLGQRTGAARSRPARARATGAAGRRPRWRARRAGAGRCRARAPASRSTPERASARSPSPSRFRTVRSPRTDPALDVADADAALPVGGEERTVLHHRRGQAAAGQREQLPSVPSSKRASESAAKLGSSTRSWSREAKSCRRAANSRRSSACSARVSLRPAPRRSCQRASVARMSWKAPWTRASTSAPAPRSLSKTRGSAAPPRGAFAGSLLVRDGQVARGPDGGRCGQPQGLLARDLEAGHGDGQEGGRDRGADEQQRCRHPLRQAQRRSRSGARIEGFVHEGGGSHRGGRMAREAGTLRRRRRPADGRRTEVRGADRRADGSCVEVRSKRPNVLDTFRDDFTFREQARADGACAAASRVRRARRFGRGSRSSRENAGSIPVRLGRSKFP